jgi:hypothetical protein
MTIGKITSSNQDIAFVYTRPETSVELETVDGGTEAGYAGSKLGQEFTAASSFSRIKMVFGDSEGTPFRVSLYNGTAKETKFVGLLMPDGMVEDTVLHWMFDPLPAGDYYWEVEAESDIELSCSVGSAYEGAYDDGVLIVGKSFRSKICYCEETEVLRAIAIDGDEVDSGVTTINGASSVGCVNTGSSIIAMAKEGDALANGGHVISGSHIGGL